LLAEAQAMFAKTISLDDVVDHAYDLLFESVGFFLTGPSLVAATNPREPPKTKSELRQMLTEAVRNTPSPNQRPKRLVKPKGSRLRPAACVD
jgi:hypothetical protein